MQLGWHGGWATAIVSTMEAQRRNLVSEYREWVDRANAPPERKQLTHAAIDAYEVLAGRDGIDPADLQPIITAAGSRYIVVWDIAMNCLVRLAESHEAARATMRSLLASPKAHVRHHVIWMMSRGLAHDFRVELLRAAFQDRAKRVRRNAYSKADTHRLTVLLPDLERRLDLEPDSTLQQALRFHIAMLRHGYVVEDDAGDTATLIVATRGGWTYQTIPKKEAEGDALAAAIARIRSQE